MKMAYGRTNVCRDNFAAESLMVTFRAAPTPASGLPPVSTVGGAMTGLSRRSYRAQIGSETGKKARWLAETVAAPKANSGLVSRNSLLLEPVLNLENTDRNRTDIAQEYFVAPERFNEFMVESRAIVSRAKAECLKFVASLASAREPCRVD